MPPFRHSHTSRGWNRHDAGFTLVEVLVAVLVLLLGLLALIALQAATTQSTGTSQARTEAIHFAQERLEQIKDIGDVADYDNLQSLDGTTDTREGTNATYTLAWTVTDHTDPDYKDLNATVRWTDPDGDAQHILLDTRLSPVPYPPSASVAEFP